MTDPAPPSMIDLANAAFKEAAQDVIRRAIETNTPIIVYQDGQSVKLDPHTMKPIASEPAASGQFRQPTTS